MFLVDTSGYVKVWFKSPIWIFSDWFGHIDIYLKFFDAFYVGADFGTGFQWIHLFLISLKLWSGPILLHV